ncbi:hypothetical protein IPM65_03030 [Candidatus Roizmanbacteria bacterium]|nr:MAG: hypothetical protein IPM65_03030 [Candidatus Roizmanbacteria bacterium]
MKLQQILKNQEGQTLVTLLVFSVMAISVAAASVAIMINTSRATHITESRSAVMGAAESGVENAILRLIRNPSYSGETLILDDNTITITVTGTDTKTIHATAANGLFRHTIQATASYIDNRLTVTSWNTVY